jgi:UDP-N-acetylmuramate dehydrogenase
MMVTNTRSPQLIDRLPTVRGRLEASVPLARHTWFRVGGPAEVLFRPADAKDLAEFMAATPDDIAVTVIGIGSNLLVRDGGIPGVVIRLGQGLSGITVEGATICAGAGAAGLHVANAARDGAIAGLEFLCGIPGGIGGALRMNAGAYGTEIKDVFVAARAVSRDGALHDLGRDDMGFAYRQSAATAGLIFVDARLAGWPGDKEAITKRMAEIQSTRRTTQPVRTPTGGSTFKNPHGAKAWELIDQAGCRGLGRGGAKVSEKHCNFLVNTGTASAADLEGLGEEVRRRVLAETGVCLEWEIQRLGIAAGPPVKEVGT